MNQLTGIFINIPYESEIQVIEPPPRDPFATYVRAISDLLRFSPQGAPGHLGQVNGVVTLFRPGKAIFIENESGFLYAQTQQESPALEPGDQVDVVGFVAVGRFAPELGDTIFRTAGKGVIPRPREITPKDALFGSNLAKANMFHSYNAELIRVRGCLTSRSLNNGSHRLLLQAPNLPFESDSPASAIP